MSTTETDYSDKNARRKQGRSVGSLGERKAARQMRKTVGGAFGKETKKFQESCLPGTVGQVSRNAKRDKSEDEA